MPAHVAATVGADMFAMSADGRYFVQQLAVGFGILSVLWLLVRDGRR